jgi:hypothetical protein
MSLQSNRFRVASTINGHDIDWWTTSAAGSGGSRMTLTDAGSLGIGTATPDGKLEIVHDSGVTNPHLDIHESSASDFARINFTSTSTDYWALAGAGGTTDRFNLFYNDGTIGVNRLSVGAGTTTGMEIQGDNDILFKDNLGANALGINTSATEQELETYSADFRIDANGGDILFETGNVVNFTLEAGGDLLVANTIKLDGLEITNLGSNNLGLDGDLVPFSNVAFDVGNNLATQHWDQFWGTSFNVFSDRRLKHDITELNGGLEKVMALKPVAYVYNSDIDPSGKPQVGFIAQDVLPIIPEAVTSSDTDIVDGVPVTTQNEYLGMEYTKIIPVLTKAIQEQQAIIEEMRAEINALKNK